MIKSLSLVFKPKRTYREITNTWDTVKTMNILNPAL